MVNLCLGGAQIGTDYGVTNLSGSMSSEEARLILKTSTEVGIYMIDTAGCYGHSESLIGQNSVKEVGVITKLDFRMHSNEAQDSYKMRMRNELVKSLERLQRESVTALLIHDCRVLSSDTISTAIGLLKEWKEEGLVLQLGCSLYELNDIEEGSCREMDIVQMPISVYDQRIKKYGWLKRLKDMGISIHARSMYLQGLLAVRAERWPSWVDYRLKSHHEAFERYAAKINQSTASLACAYIKSIEELDYVVVGVRSVNELNCLVGLWEQAHVPGQVRWDKWGVESDELVDPRKWRNTN